MRAPFRYTARVKTGGALGSVVEHRLHTAGVSGSNPLAPTTPKPAGYKHLQLFPACFGRPGIGEDLGESERILNPSEQKNMRTHIFLDRFWTCSVNRPGARRWLRPESKSTNPWFFGEAGWMREGRPAENQGTGRRIEAGLGVRR